MSRTVVEARRMGIVRALEHDRLGALPDHHAALPTVGRCVAGERCIAGSLGTCDRNMLSCNSAPTCPAWTGERTEEAKRRVAHLAAVVVLAVWPQPAGDLDPTVPSMRRHFVWTVVAAGATWRKNNWRRFGRVTSELGRAERGRWPAHRAAVLAAAATQQHACAARQGDRSGARRAYLQPSAATLDGHAGSAHCASHHRRRHDRLPRRHRDHRSLRTRCAAAVASCCASTAAPSWVVTRTDTHVHGAARRRERGS